MTNFMAKNQNHAFFFSFDSIDVKITPLLLVEPNQAIHTGPLQSPIPSFRIVPKKKQSAKENRD